MSLPKDHLGRGCRERWGRLLTTHTPGGTNSHSTYQICKCRSIRNGGDQDPCASIEWALCREIAIAVVLDLVRGCIAGRPWFAVQVVQGQTLPSAILRETPITAITSKVYPNPRALLQIISETLQTSPQLFRVLRQSYDWAAKNPSPGLYKRWRAYPSLPCRSSRSEFGSTLNGAYELVYVCKKKKPEEIEREAVPTFVVPETSAKKSKRPLLHSATI
jgi:hypothetical protein